MPANSQIAEYGPVRPARRAAQAAEPESLRPHGDVLLDAAERTDETDFTVAAGAAVRTTADKNAPATDEKFPLKRGHTLSYAGLFLFTFLVYFRPYELVSALSPLAA